MGFGSPYLCLSTTQPIASDREYRSNPGTLLNKDTHQDAVSLQSPLDVPESTSPVALCKFLLGPDSTTHPVAFPFIFRFPYQTYQRGAFRVLTKVETRTTLKNSRHTRLQVRYPVIKAGVWMEDSTLVAFVRKAVYIIAHE